MTGFGELFAVYVMTTARPDGRFTEIGAVLYGIVQLGAHERIRPILNARCVRRSSGMSEDFAADVVGIDPALNQVTDTVFSLSVNSTFDVLERRDQPSGTRTTYPPFADRYGTKTVLSGMSPGGLLSGATGDSTGTGLDDLEEDASRVLLPAGCKGEPEDEFEVHAAAATIRRDASNVCRCGLRMPSFLGLGPVTLDRRGLATCRRVEKSSILHTAKARLSTTSGNIGAEERSPPRPTGGAGYPIRATGSWAYWRCNSVRRSTLIDRLQVAGADRHVAGAATASAKLREVISGIEATLRTG